MANAAFSGKYNRVEAPAATCIPALDVSPPSVFALDAEPVVSWLQAVGAIVKAQKVRSRKVRTNLKLAASRWRLGKDEQMFTGNPPSSSERTERHWLIPGRSSII